MTTKHLVLVAIVGVAFPLLLLVGRITYVARVGSVPPSVLALDAAVMGAGTLGVVAMLGMHLQSAVTRPLREVQLRVEAIAQGRYDEVCLAAGPQEVRALASAVDALGESMEKRLDEVTQQSGVLAMGTVLNGVAHEVANPLAQMRLSIQMLLDQARAGQPVPVASLERVARGIARLEDVVETLRQSGRGQGACEPARLVQAAMIVAQRWLLRSSVETALDAKQQVECVPGDIVQALVAILRNAGESGARHVHVRTRDEDGCVAFEVEDDGAGIAKEIEEQTGQPFVTTKTGHAGLGLHRARVATTRQGGELHKVRLAQGTRIVLTLPAVGSA